MRKRILPVLILITQLLFAQFGNPDQFMQTRVYLSQDKFLPGQNIQVAFEFELYKEYHINSNRISEGFNIPTVLKIQAPEGISAGRVIYPQPISKKFSFSDKPLEVYEGKNIIWTTLAIPEHYADSIFKVTFSLSFQACNDISCFAPTSKELTIELQKAKSAEAIQYLHPEIFASFPSAESSQGNQNVGLEKTLEEKGMLVFLMILFLGGLGLNLTPCVYPIIPITIAYFAGQSEKQKGSHVLHAIFYFTGMVIMYSLLGVIAALSGSIMGAWLQNPVVIIFVALVMVALATSMFGLWEIRVPQSLASFAGKNRSGYAGTLIMGLTVGFIAAPCIGPFVLALITLVAKLGDPTLGFVMFLALSMGLGLPYLLLGIFTSSLKKIPRSGGWMIWFRNLFGFVMLGMAVYFLNPLIKDETVYWILIGILFIAAGIYSFLDKNTSVTRPGAFNAFKKAVALILVAAGIFLGMPAEQAGTEGGIDWVKYSPQQFELALQSGKPVIMDFYADWCLPCKELDKFTFADEKVQELSREFIMMKVDLTSNSDPEVVEMRKKFNIKGVPTVIFLDSSGQIRNDLSFVGFIDAREFLKKMETLMGVSHEQQ